jgi:alkanesulfonate monooxygenase SsuD/methylene tetrahydromethanopterin reductase-like flavin-dependent oxidoreductase (luciferase family)
MQTGVIGRKYELEQGMAGQRGDLYQRFLDEVKGYVQLADELGYAGYCQPEHHLQIEGFEVNNHPGMFSLFVGLHSKRLMAGTMGYTLTTHNPVRVAEEIATLDHMLQGRLFVGFTRGYHARWVDSYAAIRGIGATNATLAKARSDQDTVNREIFEESVQVVKKAWTSETFSHQGTYWQFPPPGGSAGHPAYAEFGKGQDADGIVREIGIAPRCYQDPHPKLYGAFAHSMRTVEMWAREGGKPIVLATDLDFCETLWNKYGEFAAKHGHDVPQQERGAWGGFLILTNDKQRAEERMAEHSWFWEKWFIPHGQQLPNFIVGNADEVSRQIEAAQERLGINELFLMFGQGHLEPEENAEELYRFADEVFPRFASKDRAGTFV